MCSAGCELPELALHLFILCNVVGELWSQVVNWLGTYFVHSGELRHHFILACLDLLVCSLKLFGLQLFGQFGRREIIVYSKTRFPLLILLKRLRLILSYG